jgi:hypothetical protein
MSEKPLLSDCHSLFSATMHLLIIYLISSLFSSINRRVESFFCYPRRTCPDLLDGSMVCDVGFDPCFPFHQGRHRNPLLQQIFRGQRPVDGLTWYREAELMHGRICMIAAVGFIVPGFVTFSETTGPVSMHKLTNPLEAAGGAPAWPRPNLSRSWVTSNSSVNHITKGVPITWRVTLRPGEARTLEPINRLHS